MTASMRDEIVVGEVAIRFLLEGEQSAGSVAMFEFDVRAGARVPAAHSHDGYEETIYGLAGALVWTVEGEANEVGPGEVLCIPRGAVHHFHNIREADATSLRESSAPTTSARSQRCSAQAARPIRRRSRP